jgi:hypothetical protein
MVRMVFMPRNRSPPSWLRAVRAPSNSVRRESNLHVTLYAAAWLETKRGKDRPHV